MLTKIQVLLISVFLGALIIATAWAAVQMIYLGDWVIIAMGIGLLFLCALAAWALWIELSFGLQSNALVQRILADGESLSIDDLAELPRYGADPQEIARLEEPLRKRVAEHPEHWQPLVQLGIFLGETNRKAEGRKLIREAYQLSKTVS